MEHSVIYTSPYDSEVEYLQFNGTQWIDTLLYGDINTAIECEAIVTDYTKQFPICGTRNSSSNPIAILYANSSNVKYYFVDFGQYQDNRLATRRADVSDGWFKFYTSKNVRFMQDLTTGTMYQNTNICSSISAPTYTLKIGKTESTFPNGYTNMYGKLKYLKIWSSNILVRDFIPVRVGTVGYMYDRVSKQLFANQGTGNFVLGSDVYEPNFPKVRYVMYQKPYYSEVEYLQCNGTQWLNTELMLNSNCTIAVTAQVDVTSSPIWCARGYSGGTVYNTFSLLAVTDEVPQTTIRFDYSTTDVCNYFYYQDWNTKHTYKAIANNLYIDDVLVCTAEAATFNCGGELKIFNWVNAHDTTLNYNTTGKIFGVKVWNSSNVLIFDGIPVRKGNVGYLYDKVSGQLFGNSGTGNFILGPDLRVSERCVIEDKLYQEYKWLKGDGTAVINTNLYIEDYRQIKMSITVKDFTRYSKVTYFLAAGAITGSGYGFSLSVARSNASSQYRITKSDNSVTELCSLSGEHTIQMNNGNVYADGNFITSTFEYAPLSNIKLGIFGNISGSTQPANGYISNVTLESSVGNLDLVPCKLLQDIPAILDANGIARDAGECGMWNRVNNKFYGNIKSSGMFTVSN